MDSQETKEIVTQAYELGVLLDVAEQMDALRSLIAKYNGAITEEEAPRAMQLAYPIKKHASAFFTVVRFTMAKEHMGAVQADLRLMSSVLRFLLIIQPPKQEERVVPEQKKETQEKPMNESLTNEAIEAQLKALTQ